MKILSVCLFALLVVMVLARAALLRRQGVRVIVFAKTDKRDFILVPLVLAIVYATAASAFNLPIPIPAVLIHPLWLSSLPGWVGLALCVIAVTGFALTLRCFGQSFRVGIDERKPDKLITTGVFAISRNPIYVCFLMFFTGLFLIHPSIVIAAAVLLLGLAIHRQVLREEAFLTAHYGQEYAEYQKKVRRYW